MSFREQLRGGQATGTIKQSPENSLIGIIYLRQNLRELKVFHGYYGTQSHQKAISELVYTVMFFVLWFVGCGSSA